MSSSAPFFGLLLRFFFYRLPFGISNRLTDFFFLLPLRSCCCHQSNVKLFAHFNISVVENGRNENDALQARSIECAQRVKSFYSFSFYSPQKSDSDTEKIEYFSASSSKTISAIEKWVKKKFNLKLLQETSLNNAMSFNTFFVHRIHRCHFNGEIRRK